MLRLIGILTGSALAIALLIIAIGLPSFAPPQPEPLPEPSLEPVPEAAVVVAEEPVEPEPEPVPEPVEVPEEPAPDPELEAAIEELFAEREPVEENWYAFWSPFRSEIAANGFVAKLQEKTGMDYRVVKVKTGVYEVAFAYTDDADIVSKLNRITSATGLDMSGG